MSTIPWWVEYIGIPYLAYGDTRAGCSCWGLVRLVWREKLNYDVPDFLSVKTREDLARMTTGAQWRQLEKPEPFAIALYHFPESLLHSALVINDEDILHASRQAHVARESMRKYRAYLSGFYLPQQFHQD